MKKVLLLIAAALFLLLLAACSRTDKAGADSVQTNAAPTAEPATALTEPAPEMTEAVSAAPEPETVPPEETSPTVPETTEPAADSGYIDRSCTRVELHERYPDRIVEEAEIVNADVVVLDAGDRYLYYFYVWYEQPKCEIEFAKDGTLLDPDGRDLIDLPEGETLDSFVGMTAKELKEQVGDCIGDAGSGRYIPVYCTTDGKVVVPYFDYERTDNGTYLEIVAGWSVYLDPALFDPEIFSAFKKTANGNFLSPWDEEYVFLANEGTLYAFDAAGWQFEGGVKGEGKMSRRYGFFSCKDDENKNVLIRKTDSEWYGIYRKASLPKLDISVDNCSKLQLVYMEGLISYYEGTIGMDELRWVIGEAVTDPAEISAFLSDVRSQQSPEAAGLYDLIEQENGFLENCYEYGDIYGYFAEEPFVRVSMTVTSYNDLAFSVSIGDRSYVLPEKWLERLTIESAEP